MNHQVTRVGLACLLAVAVSPAWTQEPRPGRQDVDRLRERALQQLHAQACASLDRRLQAGLQTAMSESRPPQVAQAQAGVRGEPLLR